MGKLILLILLMTSSACADVKITALPSDSSPSLDDLMITVDSPSSSPTTKKATLGVLQSLILTGNGSNLSGITIGQTSGSIPDTRVSFTDVTTGNSTTSNHGFLKKLNNDSSYYMDGTGAWSVPSAAAAGGWTDDGSVVRLTTSGDAVAIGTASQHGTDKLTVSGTAYISGALSASNVSGTNTGDQTITLTGPITGTGTSTIATSITNASITESKLTGTLSASIGGTGLSSATDDAVILGNGTVWQAKLIGDCQDSSGNHLNYTASTNTFSCGTTYSGSAAANALTGTTLAANVVSSSLTSLGTISSGTWNGTAITYTYGGTGLTAAADDNIMLGSGIGWQSKAVPDCDDTVGQHLNYDTSTNAFSCGTTTVAAGSTTQILYNDAGAIAGASALIHDKTINASSGTESSFTISPTVSQSSTAGYNGLYVNVTESSTGSGTKNLANFALGGTSKASIDDTGAVTAASYSTSSTTQGSVKLSEASANGSNFIKLSSAASRSGDVTITIDGTDGTTVTFPTTSQTLVGKTSTDTLTNKWIQPRVNTTTSSATPTINTDTTDMFTITALATAITSMTTNLSGTPVNGQKLTIRILDNGTARAITWGASFASRGVTLPTTTVLSKYLYVGLIYNSTTSTWDCVAVAQE